MATIAGARGSPTRADAPFTSRVDLAGQQRKLLWALAFSIAIGFLGIVIHASQSPTFPVFASVLGTGVIVGASFLAVGGLFGFVFAIPKLGSDTQLSEYRPNTNLEEISDWLTKILVGVGLTQLTAIPAGFRDIASFLKVGLGDFPNSEPFALVLVLYNLVCGFAVGWLWTRLVLPLLFHQADELGLVRAVQRQVSAAEQRDAAAHALAAQQLNLPPTAPDVDESELTTALAAASRGARATIFGMARETRRESRRDESGKNAMRRTIPVFRALIASEKDVTHRPFAQLGYALKDILEPAWAEAEAALSRAIEIRDRLGEAGYRLYELNRALCRIQLDPARQQTQPSAPELRAKILEDVRAAYHGGYSADVLKAGGPIAQWMERNQVSEGDLQ